MRHLLCSLLLTGCSFAVANHQASEARTRAECPSYAAPITDSVLTTWFAYNTLQTARENVPADSLDLPGTQGVSVGIGLVSSLALAVSAASGFAAVYDCRASFD